MKSLVPKTKDAPVKRISLLEVDKREATAKAPVLPETSTKSSSASKLGAMLLMLMPWAIMEPSAKLREEIS